MHCGLAGAPTERIDCPNSELKRKKQLEQSMTQRSIPSKCISSAEIVSRDVWCNNISICFCAQSHVIRLLALPYFMIFQIPSIPYLSSINLYVFFDLYADRYWFYSLFLPHATLYSPIVVRRSRFQFLLFHFQEHHRFLILAVYYYLHVILVSYIIIWWIDLTGRHNFFSVFV